MSDIGKQASNNTSNYEKKPDLVDPPLMRPLLANLAANAAGRGIFMLFYKLKANGSVFGRTRQNIVPDHSKCGICMT